MFQKNVLVYWVYKFIYLSSFWLASRPFPVQIKKNIPIIYYDIKAENLVLHGILITEKKIKQMFK